MIVRAGCCIAFLFVSAAALVAQVSTARLQGTALDQSGAGISVASVFVVHTSTGARTGTTTDARGSFVFPSLPAGTYDVAVERTGFKTAARFRTTENQALVFRGEAYSLLNFHLRPAGKYPRHSGDLRKDQFDERRARVSVRAAL